MSRESQRPQALRRRMGQTADEKRGTKPQRLKPVDFARLAARFPPSRGFDGQGKRALTKRRNIHTDSEAVRHGGERAELRPGGASPAPTSVPLAGHF